MYENKISEERNSSKPKLEKSLYGNILHCFSIFDITSYTDVRLTWFLWPRNEDVKIYNFVVYHKFQKNRFEGQKWGGNWQWIKFRKSRDSILNLRDFLFCFRRRLRLYIFYLHYNLREKIPQI